MKTWNDFLVEKAKFPFPQIPESRSTHSTRVSDLEAAVIDTAWRATYAVRDNNLVGKLCDTLKHILSDSIVSADQQTTLLQLFFPILSTRRDSRTSSHWLVNDSEPQARSLLDRGFFSAADRCLDLYGGHDTGIHPETLHPGARSRVDYVVSVDGRFAVLCEAKSPTVMVNVGHNLPSVGCLLPWDSMDQNVMRMVAQYLGLRQLEWLFLTSHNHWIVCRLVRHDQHPFLVYSPMITIEDSSEPFRAFLGAILSVMKDVPVEPNNFNPNLEFDRLDGDKAPDPEKAADEDDEDDGSGSYQGSSGKGSRTDPPVTHSKGSSCIQRSDLMITASSPNVPASSQIWVHLHTLFDGALTLPHERRVWLTRFIGSGSTGDVWQCHFDSDTTPYAMKIVELLSSHDEDRRQRLHDEIQIYLLLEEAYTSGKLHRRITPQFHGAFGSNSIDVILLGLCEDRLDSWDELSAPERDQVYDLVQNLHNIGIIHGDLEPRNVVRIEGGRFYLIDFSQSRTHVCKESKDWKLRNPQDRSKNCSELQTLRKLLQQTPYASCTDV